MQLTSLSAHGEWSKLRPHQELLSISLHHLRRPQRNPALDIRLGTRATRVGSGRLRCAPCSTACCSSTAYGSSTAYCTSGAYPSGRGECASLASEGLGQRSSPAADRGCIGRGDAGIGGGGGAQPVLEAQRRTHVASPSTHTSDEGRRRAAAAAAAAQFERARATRRLPAPDDCERPSFSAHASACVPAVRRWVADVQCVGAAAASSCCGTVH